MKKILVIFHDNNMNSGATKSFLSNVEYLIKQQKYDIYAILPNKEGKVAEYLKTKGVKVFQLKYGGSVYGVYKSKIKTLKEWLRCIIKTYISYLTYLNIKNVMRAIEIECVYSNTSTIYMGAWLAKKLNIKHIWHFREFGLEDQGSKHIFEKRFVKLAKDATHIIMISKVLQDYYVEKYHFNNSKVIYNDISDTYIIERKLEEKDTLNVLITGTLCEQKGQKVAIKAIEKINDARIHLYIAGRENQYGESLKRYVKDNHIKNIHFCGLIEDMNSLRKKIDISLVCASQEAFGRTIIEDMLANIVVIGCNTGAVPELIDDNITGYLYSYRNLEELVSKIKNIIEKKENIQEVRENAFQYALKYTKLEAAKKIEKLIRGNI